MIKILLYFFVSISLLIPVTAAHAIPPESIEIFESFSPKSFTSQVMSTTIFVIMLVAIDRTAAKLQSLGQDATTLSQTELQNTFMESAEQTLQDSQLWAGFAASYLVASGTDVATNAVLLKLNDPLQKAKIFKFMKVKFIPTVALFGWLFGSRLWKEAADKLPRADQRQKAENIWGLGVGSLSHFLLNPKKESADWEISKIICRNLFEIVFLNSKLRDHWIDNTMRLNILTGDTTLLALGFTAGAIATAGAAPTVIFLSGVAASAVTMLIPEEFKDSITRGEMFLRRKSIEQDLDINWRSLFWRIHYFQKTAQWLTPKVKQEILNRLLEERSILRSKFWTEYFEEMHMAFKISSKNEITSDSFDIVEIDHCRREDFIRNEVLNFNTLLLEVAKDSRTDFLRTQISEEIENQNYIEGFIKRLQSEFHKINILLQSSSNSKTTANDKHYLFFIEAKYENGFDEEEFLISALIH